MGEPPAHTSQSAPFQGLYVLHVPLRYTDPSGHEFTDDQIKAHLQNIRGDKWYLFWEAWLADLYFLNTIRGANYGYRLSAPLAGLVLGEFVKDGGTFSFKGGNLTDYQGKGPYNLIDSYGQSIDTLRTWLGAPLTDGSLLQGIMGGVGSMTISHREINQPIFDYSSGTPHFTGSYRVLSYEATIYKVTLMKGTGMPFLLTEGLKRITGASIPLPVAAMMAANEAIRVRESLQVTTVESPGYETTPDGQWRPAPYRSTWAHPCGPGNPLQHGCP